MRRAGRIRDYAVLAIFLSIPCITTHGTAVAVLRTPKRVIVAADSWQLLDGRIESVCKIHSVATMSYVLAGTVQVAKSGFYADALARHAASNSTTVFDAATQFEKTAARQFTTALKLIKREAPEIYDADVRRKPEPLQVAFFAVEARVPVFVITYFTVQDSSQALIVTPHSKYCPGSACPGGRGIILLGDNDAANKSSQMQSFWTGITDPVSAVRKLIQTEIDAAPSRVQAPISIVSVDAEGIHWIDKGRCR